LVAQHDGRLLFMFPAILPSPFQVMNSRVSRASTNQE